ncbi:MAG: ribosome silencing factor [Acetobacteraceae bacterium]|nr:ribosome silencing factor [Acetobacteraceae bacterium]
MSQPEFTTIARKPPAPPADTTRPTAAPRKRVVRAPATPAAIPAPPGTARKKAAAAGPAKAAPRRAKAVKPTEVGRLDQLQKVIVTSLEDDKAENVVALDLQGRAAFADRMVVATGIADRQITAMAQHLEEKLAAVGLKRVLIEGAPGSDWVLIDAGDIIVHLFKPEARALYGIERMWGADLDEAPPAADEAQAG